MLVENLTTTSAQLNGVSGVVHSLTKESITLGDSLMGAKSPTPSSVIAYNTTGNTIYFLPMTDFEHSNWGITGMIPVPDNVERIVNSFKSGEITKVVVSGSAGSHTSDLTVTVIKE